MSFGIYLDTVPPRREKYEATGVTNPVTLNEGNSWTYKWTGLPKYEDGAEIQYTVEETKTDVITGKTYTTTLPCGAALPEGAVCTCNCVVGRGGCACDGHSKSNKGSGGGGGSHYWHPN